MICASFRSRVDGRTEKSDKGPSVTLFHGVAGCGKSLLLSVAADYGLKKDLLVFPLGLASHWFSSNPLDDICWDWVYDMYLLNAAALEKRKTYPDVQRLLELMGEVLGQLEPGKIKRSKTIAPATIIRNTTSIIGQAKGMRSVTTLLTADRVQEVDREWAKVRATGEETLTEFKASDKSVWQLSDHPFKCQFSRPYNDLFKYESFGFVAVSPAYDFSKFFVDGGVSCAQEVSPPNQQFVKEFLKVMKEEKVLPQATDDALRAVARRTGGNPLLMRMFFDQWKQQAPSASVPPASVKGIAPTGTG